jgi:DNA-binding XRE family transcriptional regulator
MGVQLLKTDSGDELIVMSRRDYDALLAAAGDEDAEDRMTALIAEERRREGVVPSEVTDLMRQGNSLLKSFRLWRGKTQNEVAESAGIAQVFLSEIEARAKTPSHETLNRIASALDIPRAWID